MGTQTTERQEVREKIAEIKAEIKSKAEQQKKQKAELRKDHRTLGVDKHGWSIASALQSEVCARAKRLTELHIRYNKLRGKPWNMHEYKR